MGQRPSRAQAAVTKSIDSVNYAQDGLRSKNRLGQLQQQQRQQQCCNICHRVPAAVWCADCQEWLLCDQCDTVRHGTENGRLRHRSRAYLHDTASFVWVCSKCNFRHYQSVPSLTLPLTLTCELCDSDCLEILDICGVIWSAKVAQLIRTDLNSLTELSEQFNQLKHQLSEEKEQQVQLQNQIEQLTETNHKLLNENKQLMNPVSNAEKQASEAKGQLKTVRTSRLRQQSVCSKFPCSWQFCDCDKDAVTPGSYRCRPGDRVMCTKCFTAVDVAEEALPSDLPTVDRVVPTRNSPPRSRPWEPTTATTAPTAATRAPTAPTTATRAPTATTTKTRDAAPRVSNVQNNLGPVALGPNMVAPRFKSPPPVQDRRHALQLGDRVQGPGRGRGRGRGRLSRHSGMSTNRQPVSSEVQQQLQLCSLCSRRPAVFSCSSAAECRGQLLCEDCDTDWHQRTEERLRHQTSIHLSEAAAVSWRCTHCLWTSNEQVLTRSTEPQTLVCKLCDTECAEVRSISGIMCSARVAQHIGQDSVRVAELTDQLDQLKLQFSAKEAFLEKVSTEKILETESLKKKLKEQQLELLEKIKEGEKLTKTIELREKELQKQKEMHSQLVKAESRRQKQVRSQLQKGFPWSCPHCTYENVSEVLWKPDDRLMCEVCSRTSIGSQLVTEVQDCMEQKSQSKNAPDPSVATADTSANLRRGDTAASYSGSQAASVQTAEAPRLFDNDRDLLYLQQLTEKELQMQLAKLKTVEDAEKRQMTERQLQQREQQMQELLMRLAKEERQRIETEERLKDEASERERLQSVVLEQQRSENERRERARIEDEEIKWREAEEIRRRKKIEEAERQRKEREEAEWQRREREEAERERKERKEAERRQRKEREEADRQRKEREEAERQRKEREEAERQRWEREEAERQRKERKEAERQRKERKEAERQRKEREEAERQKWEREEAEQRRLEQQQAELLQRELAEEERRRKIMILQDAQSAEVRKRLEREEQEPLRAEQEADDRATYERVAKELRLISRKRMHRNEQEQDASGRGFRDGEQARPVRSDEGEWQMTATGYDDIDKAYTSGDSDDFEEPRVAGRRSVQKAVKLQCAHCGKYRNLQGRIEAVGFQCFSCNNYTCKMCGRLWNDKHTGRSCQEFARIPGSTSSSDRTSANQSIGNRPRWADVGRPGSERNPLVQCTRCRCTVDTNIPRHAATVNCRNCGNVMHLPRPY